ncbi:MAG TPA: hypothetical protein VFE15_03895 [Marmoricola sp.]|jgi:hypothetical protein|nr:hypothetical protein [Marmoricola sp.]
MASTVLEQEYGPTSGVVTGWIGMVLCAVLIVAVPVANQDLGSARIAVGVGVAAALIWMTMLRPRIIVRLPDILLLRNPLSTWEVPLAAVESVSVRAITRVGVGERTYDGVAVGRPVRPPRPAGAGLPGFGGRRGVVRSEPPTGKARLRPNASTPNAIADLMTEQLLAAADRARAAGQSDTGIDRVWAVPELAVLGALTVALVILLLV